MNARGLPARSSTPLKRRTSSSAGSKFLSLTGPDAGGTHELLRAHDRSELLAQLRQVGEILGGRAVDVAAETLQTAR